MAIQIGKAAGATVAVTASRDAALARCAELGADIGINYADVDFVQALLDATDGHGADVILDVVGAKYLQRNVSALAHEGSLAIIGMQGGTRAELDLGLLMRKRGAVIATSLRSRPVAEKAAICSSVVEHVWPLVADGSVRTLVHTTLPLERAGEAHQIMEASDHIGKIVLTT
jgi:NADPH:quinone reductase-like Zn-dependent oxidoreductase